MKQIASSAMLLLSLVVVPLSSAQGQSSAPRTDRRGDATPAPTATPVTNWGGGYFRGGDSASVTVATSGAGTAPLPLVTPAPAPATMPMTDWGGGYWRGADSASTTVATSGAGSPKPNN